MNIMDIMDAYALIMSNEEKGIAVSEEVKSFSRVCLITNYNLYESKRYFTEKLSEAMRSQGVETLLIDVDESTLNPDVITSIMRFKPDFTCSFNTLMPFSNNTFLWDYLETPHWSILVDPAMYSVELINSPYSIISCVDQEDCQTLRSQPFERVFFFPHAVEKELVGSGKKDKIYDVVFLGSCYDYESLETFFKQEHPKPIVDLIEEASHMVLSDPFTSVGQALCHCWSKANLNSQDVDFLELFYFIDRYTRGKERVELIRSIKDAKVDVFGDFAEDEGIGMMGWKHYLANCKNVTIHPPLSYAEGLEVLKQSRISLNSMPFFKRGSHERAFYSLACGAMPLTPENAYWKEHFVDGKDMVFYKYGNWQDINDKVNHFLANETSRSEIAHNGAVKVERCHTWDQRVSQLRQTPFFNKTLVSKD